jgi:hypothetical protein
MQTPPAADATADQALHHQQARPPPVAAAFVAAFLKLLQLAIHPLLLLLLLWLLPTGFDGVAVEGCPFPVIMHTISTPSAQPIHMTCPVQ